MTFVVVFLVFVLFGSFVCLGFVCPFVLLALFVHFSFLCFVVVATFSPNSTRRLHAPVGFSTSSQRSCVGMREEILDLKKRAKPMPLHVFLGQDSNVVTIIV